MTESAPRLDPYDPGNIVMELEMRRKQVEELRAALEAAEWIEDTYVLNPVMIDRVFCPWCHATYRRGTPPSNRKHKDTCQRQAALAHSQP